MVEVTTAAESRSGEIAARQRRYLISMGLRTLCFVLAVVTTGWVRWAFVAAAVLLPYVAVVAANAAAELRAGTPEQALPGDGSQTWQALPGPDSTQQGRPET